MDWRLEARRNATTRLVKGFNRGTNFRSGVNSKKQVINARSCYIPVIDRTSHASYRIPVHTTERYSSSSKACALSHTPTRFFLVFIETSARDDVLLWQSRSTPTAAAV